MKDYLVFQLYAPLVSWGTQAVGQERPIEDHPSRSALLGLLAAGLGIDRADEEAHAFLADACHFGVKLLAPGLALRDFHTTQVPPANKKTRHLYTRRDELGETRLGTMLSFRSYRQDALAVVAVMSDHPEWPLARLKQALLTPCFHLYLGRKSCPPALPLNPDIRPANTLKAALDGYAVFPDINTLIGDNARYYWEAGMEAGMDHDYRVPRYDQPISRKRWQFAPRDECVSLGGE